MGRLLCSALASVDGYVADARGRFDWAEPDDEVHAAVNELVRPAGTFLYGRRMYETLAGWQELGGPGEPAVVREFAEQWRAAEKVVWSTTLERVATPRTRLERAFDPAAVRRLKADAPHDLTIGGPTLAAAAFRAGLVDELQLFLVPVVVGGGTRVLPDGVRLDLTPLEERRFAGGTVLLRYGVQAPG